MLAELEVIRSAAWKTKPIILIDDAHMYKHPWPAELRHFDERQWPGIDEITEGLPGYCLVEHAGILCFFSRAMAERGYALPSGQAVLQWRDTTNQSRT